MWPDESGTFLKKRNYRSDIPVPAQPVRLRPEVPVDNVALLVLEAPRDHDQGIAFPYPGPLLHLALDPAHPGDPVNTLDLDVVCPEHCSGEGELFLVPFFWQPHTDDRSAVRMDCIQIGFFTVFLMKTHSTNYVWYIDGG